MSNIKYYDLPQEILDLLDEYANYISLKEMYTKVPFGFKKAIKSGKIAIEKSNKFWNKIYELYPELKNKNVKFTDDRRLFIAEEI